MTLGCFFTLLPGGLIRRSVALTGRRFLAFHALAQGFHEIEHAVNVKDKLGWNEAKAFAEAVCSAMAADSPDRYLLNMSKKLRTGRIFLDYLRNDRMSTAIAPLSPRMRPGAPVSMPVHWGQVRRGLDPQRFTLKTAPSLLAKSKPWECYCASQNSLKAAIRKLVYD